MRKRSVLAYAESDTKLDLPSTGSDFAALAGDRNAIGLTPRPYSFKSSASGYSSATGVATITIGIPPGGYEWRIERMVVVGAGTARVYVGAVQSSDEVDFTIAGAEDVSDEKSAIFVPSGVNLIVQFTGAGAGTLCTVSYQGTAIPI
jgi:hypothetical protein